MKKLKQIIFSLILVFGLVLFAQGLSYAQCAMCRATVESNIKTESGPGKGLNTGILYLMSFPYITIGLVAFFWYRNSKRDTDRHNKMMDFIRRKLA